MRHLVKITPNQKCTLHFSTLLLPIDNYPCQSFNLGFNGLPANDLTLLERAQSAQEIELILRRLNEIKSQGDMSGRTDREIVLSICPRWCQTPAELDKFMDYYYNNVVEPSLKSKEPAPDSAPDPAPDPASGPAPDPAPQS